MKTLSLILFIFLFASCSMSEPSTTEYRIIADTKIEKNNLGNCKNKSLKIMQAFSSTSLMTTKMDYVLDDNKVFSYSQAQWSNTPNRSISLELLKSIRDAKLFKYTQNSKTRSRSDLVLETNIEDFVQYYNTDLSASYANIVMSFSLIDLKTNQIIAANTFKSRVDANTQDAQGGSKALNIALSEVLGKTIQWLGDTCK